MRKTLLIILILLSGFLVESYAQTDKFHSNEYIQIRERLIKLETEVCLKFDERDKALDLATDLSNKHFYELNQSKEHLAKVEVMFATKEYVEMLIEPLRKLIYIGVGIFVAINALLWWLKKGYK